MNQGSCSIFCAGAFMSHHDSVLFQKGGTTGLTTGSLSCIDVLYLSPGAPPEFPPSYLLPQLLPWETRFSKIFLGLLKGKNHSSVTFSGLDGAVVPAYQEPQNSHPILSSGWKGIPEAIIGARCSSASTSLSGIGWKPWSIINLTWDCLSLEDTILTSKLNKQGPKSNKSSNVIRRPRRGSNHIKLGIQEVRVSLIPWPYWLYLCSHSACSSDDSLNHFRVIYIGAAGFIDNSTYPTLFCWKIVKGEVVIHDYICQGVYWSWESR